MDTDPPLSLLLPPVLMLLTHHSQFQEAGRGRNVPRTQNGIDPRAMAMAMAAAMAAAAMDQEARSMRALVIVL